MYFTNMINLSQLSRNHEQISPNREDEKKKTVPEIPLEVFFPLQVTNTVGITAR